MGAKRGPKPGTENARHGGQAVAAKYGPLGHYARIGKIGGESVRDSRPADYFAAIGQKGGLTTLARHGVEHYERAGAKGGKSPHPARDRGAR